jgi:hypothetical protein
MKRAACLMVIAVFAGLVVAQTPAQSAGEKITLASRVAGLEKRDGFIPYYWDEKKGAILLELSPAALAREFLYFNALGSGIGSPEVFADRSSFAGAGLCRFRRVGMRVLVIQENTDFRATAGSAELKHSVEFSFPTSVLAALPIEAEQDGTVLVNASPLLMRDATDLLSQLRRPTRAVGGTLVRQESSQGASWRLDADRSVVDLEHTGSFPLNTEVEMLMTFTSDSESDLNQPDAHTLSIREHHSFVALPAPGFEPREQDPRVGFFGPSFEDFSQPFDAPLRRHLIDRWRLQKAQPKAALSEPVKPIVLYLDRAMPEPMRSAARRGALWWNRAFEQAGFKNALRVEDLPEGADPLDIRYPTIQWTNRSGRGWSVGMSQVDPRTGEIVHAVVQLDSHRMRTASNYWDATTPSGRTAEPALDAFAALDNLDPKLNAEQVMLNRLALLTCHEVGHILGLAHNFVASTYDRGSVMDYFAPRVKIRPDGSADLSDAYMQGVGSYDRFAIEWGYSQDPPGATAEQQHARLDSIARSAIGKGIVWGNEDDPRWNAYDDGPDPVAWLKEVLPVRDALLKNYGPQMLRPGEPASMLASRFPLIYLFHRYALGAAINVVGSAKIPLSLAGDAQTPVTIWPGASQQEALTWLLKALDPNELGVSPELWKALAPLENTEPDAERFTSSAGYLYSPQDGARAVAEIVVGGLLYPQRLERLKVMSAQDPSVPSPDDIIAVLIRKVYPVERPETDPITSVLRAEITERLMVLAANADAPAEIRAAALAGVNKSKVMLHIMAGENPDMVHLQHEVDLFLQNPKENTPKVAPLGVPAGPPV